MADVDWAAVKLAYIKGDGSYRELAAKYGVSMNTLGKRAKREGWAEEKRQYAHKVTTKALARAQARDVKRLANLQSAGTKMCNELERLMKKGERELHTHVNMEGEEVVTQAVNDKKLLNIARSIDTMSRAMRNLYDIQTAAEKAQTAAALAKAREHEDKGIDGVEITLGNETLEEYTE